ncbi:DUF1236 domain-containing protein [Pararhizobium sp. BT-229]|uniref:DUF1236 domain-containing protein n=1 Tax=Pararhizobium sp. BT-229 TaxID=2986923 RepID=UPI0021F72622|nr:DUF1236 domain-containing protein [Pararhizobium sp. BT-229]MCV9967503.1 DUF1236 domain-containing protein [Pararhizobium sp. BT-229]
MKTKILILTTAVLGMMSTAALAEDGAITGAAGGAVTGAIVGGPVGAAVGGTVGLIAGAAIDAPPQKVVTYVEQQPIQQSVVVEQPLVVGKPIPQDVVLVPVPEDTRYAYAVVNNQRVIVDPRTHTVVQVLQ